MINIPRHLIVETPTPLARMPSISAELGIDLWMKRDDLAGPSMGGNKSRQLEYYFGAALAERADTILITGAVQSNFVRLSAAVAKSLGMGAVVQLENRVKETDATYERSGNVILNQLLGADIMLYPEGEDEAGADRALYERADALRGQGRRPYVIPLSEDHPPLGALGYVNAGHEICHEKNDFDVFIVASGSGATHSGLLAGVRGAGSKAHVIGSCVRRGKDLQGARIGRIIERMKDLCDEARQVAPEDILIWDGALAPGYGQVGPAALASMRMVARQEGLLLDPVYTSKSFAAIPALVGNGTIPQGARVCYVHTGGLAALFAYADVLSGML